ncbi:fibronectin type III domain-containing protein [Foetidibacter luteolus]|uniref:fibronectin type III domain-containing protein n=1 Tax=Foetidibacter luteolus TaxID=2608880 RepID=UPI00129B2276|nr:PA14 domain-containing protein [Foetidibacter luteolus]
MNLFTRSLVAMMLFFALAGLQSTQAQTGVLDPADNIVVYNPDAPPANPAFGTMAKWVKTNRLGWNTSSFKSYFYKGVAFRLKFPKTYQHNVNDGKKYPVFVFFHGRGEKGTIYDNEYQLYHGGELHMNAVDNGLFDGFLLYPQSQTDGWSSQSIINEIIQNYLVPQVKADPWRVYVNGLSAGGEATWKYMVQFPKFTTACLPISNTNFDYLAALQQFKFTPTWQFQGGVDAAPAPGYTKQLGDSILAAGGNYKVTVYPDQGHGCWYSAWNEADYFPFMVRAYKSNPWVLGGRTEFCPGDPINITVGVTPGFDAYEWRKDGVLMSETSNAITVTAIGTYECRIKNGANWSEWSRIPVIIKLKQATLSPDIQLTAGSSAVLPVLDGSEGVKLEVPAGYTSYLWRKKDSATTLSTTRFLTATAPGKYEVKVTEQYGCYSSFSNPFTVVDGNAANGPTAPTSLTVTPAGITSASLAWAQDAAPVFNETGFEVYQATAQAGPYKLVTVTAQNAAAYTATGLTSATAYWFKLRAVNANAASSVTAPVQVVTLKDTLAPSAPQNLRVSAFSRNEVTLQWDASTDDVGVIAYDIYSNGVKSYVTTGTAFTLHALTANTTYNFIVKARDYQGNTATSNQVTATTYAKGLTYQYYNGIWDVLPDFNALMPAARGVVPNISISTADESEYFGFLFQGYIKITQAGSYTFRLNSDDGSKLYINVPYSHTATPLVNNDGLHGSQDVDGNITLNAGVYPIAVTFFQKAGGANCNLSWKVPGSSSFVAVPDSVFTDGFVVPGTAPAAPSALTATAKAYNAIKLQWTDKSNNETGFEIYRSSNATGPFSKVAISVANSSTYTDSLLSASTTYYYKIKAIGKYGESDYSDGATSQPVYYYYEGSYDVLPNFSAMTAKRTGNISNFNISIASVQDNFAFRFESIINIPTTGNYTFYTASDDGSQLFIDGNLVVNNDGLHGTVERSGQVSLTAGVHNIRVTFFERGGDQVLNVNWQGPGFAKQAIPDAVLKITPANATTFAIPGAPAVPSGVSAVAESSSSIRINWNNSDATVTKFELYRSAASNSFYTLAATVNGSTLAYADSGLTSNTAYYYKVRAFNVSGYSGYSSEVNKTTLNNIPKLAAIPGKTVPASTQYVQAISATDADSENISISFLQLPSFAVYTGTGNGTGSLTFSPAASNVGVYNIKAIAADAHGGADTVAFTITVNNRQSPVLNSIANVTVTEGSTSSVNITGTYQSGDVISLTATNLPAFATLLAAGNNSFSMLLNPSAAQVGSYNNITLTATNQDGVSATQTFNVLVAAKTSTSILINFNAASGVQQALPWNSTKGIISAGSIFANLKDENSASTNVNLTLVDAWTGTAATGATANGAGVYPDNVIKTMYYENSSATKRLLLSGLSSANKYDFEFFASRSGSATSADNRITRYSIGTQTVQLGASPNNISQTVQIAGIIADSAGQVQINIAKDAGSQFAHIGALVIKSKPADNSNGLAIPIATATAIAKNKIRIDWTNASGNTASTELWRGASATAAFTKIGTAGTGVYTYVDSSLSASTAYYYVLRSAAGTNYSAFSNAVNATTPSGIVAVPAGLTATAAWTNKIVLSWSLLGNETAFEVLRSNSVNGNYAVIATLAGNSGNYKDSFLTAATTYFYKIRAAVNGNYSDYTNTVSAATYSENIPAVYINFNTATSTQQATPWNNLNGLISAGASLTGINDEAGAATGITLLLEEAWTGAAYTGAGTGNNSGVYPDNVMKSLYYESSGAVKHIQLNGLSANKKYDVVFFGSRSGNTTATDNRITQYSIGAKSVSLSAANNTTQTVTIKSVSPDASGQILVSVAKDANSAMAVLNSIVLVPHWYDGTPYIPVSLTATGAAKDKIKLAWQLNDSVQDSVEIWRSVSANTGFVKVGATVGTATTFTDAGLTGNTIYYYKIRAAKAPLYSAYSNVAASGTVLYNVNINFNDGSVTSPAQGGNWNNTNTLISTGFTLSNLVTDEAINTGINLGVAQNFSGYNTKGAVTGNNSGIVPDNVIKGFYYVNFKDTARLLITNLNQSMLYNFVFFGSTTTVSNTTTLYWIGNESVSLNPYQNTSNTVQINNVQPDANGNVLITIYSPVSFGYLNYMSIQALPSPNPVVAARKATAANTVAVTKPAQAVAAPANENIKAFAYPNPFVDYVTLSVNLQQDVKKVVVTMTDVKGNAIKAWRFSNVSKGKWQQNLALSDAGISNGLYFVKISIPGEKDKVIRLVK